MFSHSSPVTLSLQRKVEAEMAGSHGRLPAHAMGFGRLSGFNAEASSSQLVFLLLWVI